MVSVSCDEYIGIFICRYGLLVQGVMMLEFNEYLSCQLCMGEVNLFLP